MTAPKFQDIKKMSIDELKEKYDSMAVNTVVGTQFYLDEIRSRENQEVAKNVRSLTKIILILTIIMTITTILNLIFVFRK